MHEIIKGLDKTDEQIMTFIKKHDIPKNTGAIDPEELISKLDDPQCQKEVDRINVSLYKQLIVRDGNSQ